MTERPAELTREPEKEHPLVTFALFAYNQEKFIEEAVQGAFSQTYSPLEIIISDDASTDKTREKIEKVVTQYQGPHEIIMNINSENLGIARHINKLMKLCRGDIVVGAAGDDVSLPNRVLETVKVFQEHSAVMSLYTATIKINEIGNELGIQTSENRTYRDDLIAAIKNWCPGTLGASHAWKRELFNYFGNLSPRLVTEDRVLPMRAVLLGEIRYLPKPLVKYRVHSAGISQITKLSDPRKYFEREAFLWRQGLAVLRNYRSDILVSLKTNKLEAVKVEGALSEIEKRRSYVYLQWRFFASERWRERLGIIFKLAPLEGLQQALKKLILLTYPEIYLRKLRRVRK